MRHIPNSTFYRGLVARLKENGNDSPEVRKQLREGLTNLSDSDWELCKRVTKTNEVTEWLAAPFIWDNTKEGFIYWDKLDTLIV